MLKKMTLFFQERKTESELSKAIKKFEEAVKAVREIKKEAQPVIVKQIYISAYYNSEKNKDKKGEEKVVETNEKFEENMVLANNEKKLELATNERMRLATLKKEALHQEKMKDPYKFKKFELSNDLEEADKALMEWHTLLSNESAFKVGIATSNHYMDRINGLLKKCKKFMETSEVENKYNSLFDNKNQPELSEKIIKTISLKSELAEMDFDLGASIHKKSDNLKKRIFALYKENRYKNNDEISKLEIEREKLSSDLEIYMIESKKLNPRDEKEREQIRLLTKKNKTATMNIQEIDKRIELLSPGNRELKEILDNFKSSMEARHELKKHLINDEQLIFYHNKLEFSDPSNKVRKLIQKATEIIISRQPDPASFQSKEAKELWGEANAAYSRKEKEPADEKHPSSGPKRR